MFFKRSKPAATAPESHAPAPVSVVAPASPTQTANADRPEATAPAPAQLPPQGNPLPDDRARSRAAKLSHSIELAFGQITSVLMRTPQYKTLPLGDLEWLVVPAVLAGTYSLAEARSRSTGITSPVGVLLWASVSADVDERLSRSLNTPLRLAPSEWKSGDILWVIDAIGEPKVIEAMIQRAQSKDWAGNPVKVKMRDGKVTLQTRTIRAAASSPHEEAQVR